MCCCHYHGRPCSGVLQALNRDQQLSRVERWAQKGPADSQVLAEVKGFWSEVEKRLAEAHRTMMVLALHKVAHARITSGSACLSVCCSQASCPSDEHKLQLC